MSRTTVSQRVAQFLRDHRRYGAYCDKCIAKELRLGAGKNRTMARNVTSVLAVRRMSSDGGPGSVANAASIASSHTVA
jgi:hypothetical protein